MKILLIVVCCLLLAPQGKAFTLSPDAQISILTCAPGTELYSLFGHTAIRIQDPQEGYDRVFNYGTFDFQTPYFYLKYAQGLLPYQLTQTSFENFMYAYQLENRSVYSQTLQLDSLQKQTLLNLLLENYQPENRSYLYNFLFDNCTTRSRDILLKSLPDKLHWNYPDSHKSFWNLLDEYLRISPWVQWGIHTILGQGGNRKATTFEYMFLPDYLMYSLNTARYNNGQRLAEEARLLYKAPESIIKTPWYTHPLFIFAGIALTLIILIHQLKSRIILNTVAVLMFLFTGMVGCLIVFLGAFTEHPITAPNWNILWANPLNLFALLFILRKNIPRFVLFYLKIYLALLTIAIPVWALAQPAVPLASISIIVLMLYLTLQLRGQRIKYLYYS